MSTCGRSRRTPSMNASPSSRRRRRDDVAGRQTPSHACEDGEANRRLQKRAAIVSRLFFQRKYQLRRVEAETTCSERYGAMGVRGANRRANGQSTKPDRQCPSARRGPQCFMDAHELSKPTQQPDGGAMVFDPLAKAEAKGRAMLAAACPNRARTARPN